LADIRFGNYNALVIGSKNYNHLTKLKTAINDAKSLAASLEKTYGIKVRLLSGPTLGNITDAVDDSLKMLELQDSLLIYCASHGWLDEATDLEYWLPVDAKQGRRLKWLSKTDITDTLKSRAAKQVMVIADS